MAAEAEGRAARETGRLSTLRARRRPRCREPPEAPALAAPSRRIRAAAPRGREGQSPSSYCGLSRQPHDDVGALADGREDLDAAAVQVDHATDQRQADT